MKLYAIFDYVPKVDSSLTGNWHVWTTPSGHVLLVCEPHDYGKGEAHLLSLGGQVFPCVLDPSPIGNLASHPSLSGSWVTATDTTFSAAKKLMTHFGWPMLDPRKL